MGKITKQQLSDGLIRYIKELASNAGTGGGSLSFKKNSVTLSQSAERVTIGIEGYNKNTDLLMVYKNTVYLEEGSMYNISEDSLYITNPNGQWNNDIVDSVFNFVVLKGSTSEQPTSEMEPALLASKYTNNKLCTKSILCFGDHIFTGKGNNGVGIIDMISSKNIMKCYNYACEDATVVELKKNTNNIIEQISRAIQNKINPEYIIFTGLVKDVDLNNIELGNIITGYTDEFDSTKFSGAFELICKMLKTNWLGSKILYVRPHNIGTLNFQKQKLFGERALEICKKWSLPVVDLYSEGGLNTNIPAMRSKYTLNGDSINPNESALLNFYLNPIDDKLQRL